MATDSIPNRLLEQSNLRPSAPAYYVRDNGVWRATSWGTYSDQVKQAGRALMTLGFSSGDTTTILGFNRPEWVVLNVATMGAGGACAGIYTTCSPEEVAYIINHCEARFILVENEQQWEKVKHERDAGNLQKLEHVITMKGAPNIDDDMVMTWEEFLAKGDETDESGYLDRVKALKPDDLATFIYTSGTTGPPKGVMLSHYNLTWTATGACTINDLSSEDVSLSYLPLSHIAEQMFTVHAPITVGSRVYFAESIDAVPENLKEVQPTVFFGVPRIWEKFYAGINSKLKLATGPKAKLVKWAQSIGREANLSPNGHKGLRYKLANKLIFSKLKPAVGLARARICVSGAAPISQEILEFFASLDIVIYEVYGQSEDTGPTSFNMPSKYQFGSVGPAFPGVEVKIAEDGEILVKGPNVFQGYFKDEAATNEALIDGWLHSGDLGEFKGEFLYITGRKKDIIITAGGKNIAPKNIEAALKNHELINEAVVIGDRRKYLTALVTLDPEASEAWAKQNGVAVDGMNENDTLRAEIQKCVDEVNSHFARVEQLKKFKVLHRNLTVEDGELTPTLKVKRKKVNEHFADDIESLYT